MKKVFNFYRIIILLTLLLPAAISFGQCENASPPNYEANFGRTFNFGRCPARVPTLGGVMVYVTIDGNEICEYNYINKSNPNVIYWPKGKPLRWYFRFTQFTGDFNYCKDDNYFQTGPSPGNYSGGSEPQVLNPTQTGLHTLGGRVVLKVRGWNRVWVKTKWGGYYKIVRTGCPDKNFPTHEETIFFNVCVIDIGGSGTITPGACGENILKRPENTSEYTYYWQGTSCGESTANGAAIYPITQSGTYYLRARHNATGVWGECTSYNATIIATPPVPTVNLNNCGNVTLTMPTPPPGITYYWQGTSCNNPGSTANNANIPYPVDAIGKTYYVMAYNGACSSACSQVTTPTVNAVLPPLVSDVYRCACDLDPSGGDPMEIPLSAVISPPATTCKWYSSPTGNSLLYTGTDYPADAFGDRTFYVSAFNSANGCESSRVPLKVIFKACEKCLDAFSPIPGKEYVISAWVKEQNGFNATTYTNAYITLLYSGAGPSISQQFKGSGEIIEGWQKIEERFVIPLNTNGIKVQLNNGGTNGDVFFDDIRIFPFKGNMVSYVYDPVTLKLVAQLVENNYATYYIYDDDGILTKVKKETTDGIKTVKEGRANTVINNTAGDACN